MQNVEQLDFGDAIKALKKGQKLCRAGWNGKGMYIFLIGEKGLNAGYGVPFWYYWNGVNDKHPVLPFLAMKTADDMILPWVTSQADVLANDWLIFN